MLGGISHIMGFNIGVLHVIILMFSKHFSCKGDHLNGIWFMQIFCKGPVYAPMFGRKQARYSIRSRNCRTSVWSFGVHQFLILDNLSTSVWIPFESTLQPNISSTGAYGSNFFRLMYNFSILRHSYTQINWSLCSCMVSVPMNISSNQTCMSSPIRSWNTHIRTH